jgi:hypothetical protein
LRIGSGKGKPDQFELKGIARKWLEDAGCRQDDEQRSVEKDGGEEGQTEKGGVVPLEEPEG